MNENYCVKDQPNLSLPNPEFEPTNIHTCMNYTFDTCHNLILVIEKCRYVKRKPHMKANAWAGQCKTVDWNIVAVVMCEYTCPSTSSIVQNRPRPPFNTGMKVYLYSTKQANTLLKDDSLASKLEWKYRWLRGVGMYRFIPL